jgi:hypothetical protein
MTTRDKRGAQHKRCPWCGQMVRADKAPKHIDHHVNRFAVEPAYEAEPGTTPRFIVTPRRRASLGERQP